MAQWIQKERDSIREMREILGAELTDYPHQFPEVVGDRRLLRFLRAKQHNVEAATKMYSEFLTWRRKNNVDAIRQDILYGGKNSPYLFPYGRIILELAPQIIICPDACDYMGNPLTMDSYNFLPADVLAAINLEQYLEFLKYMLEFRVLVVEQMSHEREQEYLKKTKPEDREDGWGQMVMVCNIRDLNGVGIAHLGSDGRSMVGSAIRIGEPNYPEYLHKSHMINVPWIFNVFWLFVHALLDEHVIAKVSVSRWEFLPTLLEDMPIETVPEMFGGELKEYNQAYEFDLAEGGCLWCPKGSSTGALKAHMEREKSNTAVTVTTTQNGDMTSNPVADA